MNDNQRRRGPGGHTQRHRNESGHERSGSRGRGGSRRGYSKAKPGERRRESTPSRLAAYEAYREVTENEAYANLVFPRVLRKHRVEGRDAGFATELFYGAMRAQGRLDAVLAECVDRPLTKVDANVVNVLRLGAYQMLDMEVPPHAAASETVGLARDVTGAGAASLVNAVLRRVGEKTADEWMDLVAPISNTPSDDALAIRYSHPAWIVRALRDALKAHGRDQAELEDLLRAHNAAPRVSLVIRPGLAEPSELEAEGAEPATYSILGATWPGGDPGKCLAVSEGRAAVQDEGSQLTALALAVGSDDLVDAGSPRWLDLCSGPGGKTAILGGMAIERDSEVLAVEVQDHRADLVRRAVETLIEAGADIETVTADGSEIGSRFPGEFSRVLADVPCSGLGALRRRPEARWRKQPGDIGQLGRLQRSLLASAIDATEVGGVVAYVTCSPHVAETVLVAKDTARKRHDVELIDARDAVRAGVVPGTPIDLGEGPYVQLWPHIHGTDAMFLALFKKTA